ENESSDLAEAAEAVAPWIIRLARVGYASKGLVYLVIGVMAALAAAGLGGATTDGRGAFTAILRQPFGTTIVAISIVGLLGYAVWRTISAVKDTEHRGNSLKGIGLRIGQVGSAILALVIAFQAWRVLGGDLGESRAVEEWTRRIMHAPLGRWIVGIIGAAITGYALFQLYKGIAGNVTRHLKLWTVDEKWQVRFERIARFGLAARGLVLLVVGWFMIGAAMKFTGDSARDIDGALDTFAAQQYGAAILSVISFGLVSYGLLQMINARWRRIEVD
ncbi:MAG TPA: DUF1206 domain-containing protein, partial [Gemmatimonadaceae bacterium]|nr:DUF1206 domain-containing protein [Gemmatimonadaceae bacterium]